MNQLVVLHVRHDAKVLVQRRQNLVPVTQCACGHTRARALKELPGAQRHTDLPRAGAKMGNCIVPYCDGPINTNVRFTLPAVCFVWEISMIILFGVFVRYDEEADTHWVEFKAKNNITSDIDNDFYFRYPSKSSSEWLECLYEERVWNLNYVPLDIKPLKLFFFFIIAWTWRLLCFYSFIREEVKYFYNVCQLNVALEF